MHSRIIQISREPVAREEWIEEFNYFDGFVGNIADYVTEITETDREMELKELDIPGIEIKKLSGGNDEEPNVYKLIIHSRETYFANKYKGFIDALRNDITNITIQDFMDRKFAFDIWNLYNLVEDKYDLYIDDTGEYFGLENFDGFMRCVNDGDEFYIGGMMDYHC